MPVSRGGKVDGFDYVTGKQVSMTPAEWRTKYPPDTYTRATTGAKGETWYRGIATGGLVAEAYAIIPAGK